MKRLSELNENQLAVLEDLRARVAQEKRVTHKERWSSTERNEKMRSAVLALRSIGVKLGDIDDFIQCTKAQRSRFIKCKETWSVWDGHKYNRRKILELYDAGRSRREICDEVGCDASYLCKYIAVQRKRSKRSRHGSAKYTMPIEEVRTLISRKVIEGAFNKDLFALRIAPNQIITSIAAQARREHAELCKNIKKKFDLERSKEMIREGASVPLIATVLQTDPWTLRHVWKTHRFLIDEERPVLDRRQRSLRRQFLKEKYGSIALVCVESRTNVPNTKKLRQERPYTRRFGITFHFDEFKDRERLFMHCRHISSPYTKTLLPAHERFEFVRHFYSCPLTTILFVKWRAAGRDKWAQPSLDHIIPVSRGGVHCLQNLRYVTRFENFMKQDRTTEEWLEFRRRTGTSSELFIENIVIGMQSHLLMARLSSGG